MQDWKKELMNFKLYLFYSFIKKLFIVYLCLTTLKNKFLFLRWM